MLKAISLTHSRGDIHAEIASAFPKYLKEYDLLGELLLKLRRYGKKVDDSVAIMTSD